MARRCLFGQSRGQYGVNLSLYLYMSQKRTRYTCFWLLPVMNPKVSRGRTAVKSAIIVT